LSRSSRGKPGSARPIANSGSMYVPFHDMWLLQCRTVEVWKGVDDEAIMNRLAQSGWGVLMAVIYVV
jgi:hypothetical protein